MVWKADIERAQSTTTDGEEATTSGTTGSEAQERLQTETTTTDSEEATTSGTTGSEAQERLQTEAATTTTGSEAQAVEIDMSPNNANQSIIRMSLDDLADMMVNVEGQADRIIEELREDPFLRQIMDHVDEQVDTQPDEGIDISPLDDIEWDIEPFDYEVEVEPYDW